MSYRRSTESAEPILDALQIASEAIKHAEPIRGVPSGVEGLDDLFYIAEFENGRPVRRNLGGYPQGAVVNLTGVPDTGKSLMGEQFAVKQASLGNPILFVTVETPAPFVSQSLEFRANAMGLPWKDMQDSIYLLDAASRSQLREDLPSLLTTMAYAYKQHRIRHTVIDSVTGLYEAREIMARGIVREVYNLMKRWHQTAILITQKRSAQEETSAEAAGGYAVGHIVDCTIVLSKHLIERAYEEKIYKAALGEVVRTIRIDGCRLSGHDQSTHILEISDLGLVKVGPPLSTIYSSDTK